MRIDKAVDIVRPIPFIAVAGSARSPGKRSDQPARLVEGQRAQDWCDAPNELDKAYPSRPR